MFAAPKRLEIDHRTMKLIVGVVAISLAALTSYFSRNALSSISAAYYEGGWSQAIFIGFLFAISAFLLAYNGRSGTDMVMSKVASIAGLGVALFPCRCGDHPELVPHLHGLSAVVMFLVLAYFCYGFLRRAWAKGYGQARTRAVLYAACGIVIVAAIVVLALDGATSGALSRRIPRLTFYGEAAALVAFGVSWLLASHVLPLLNRSTERYLPFRAENPAP